MSFFISDAYAQAGGAQGGGLLSLTVGCHFRHLLLPADPTTAKTCQTAPGNGRGIEKG